MFSPKVLDRANVVEFNDIDLKNYEKGVVFDDQFKLKDPDIREKLLPENTTAPFCSKADYSKALKVSPEANYFLIEILDILYPYNLHFGYRVVNEMSAYSFALPGKWLISSI